jgi:HD-like signal output (HDOD) protein
MTTPTVNEVLDKLQQLPTISAVVQEVIASFDDPNLDAAKLARNIGQDQGLVTKVLRVSNSAFYGLPRQVGSIQEAVVVLGFANVRTLVIAAGLVGAFPAAQENSAFDRKQFWRDSARTALCARLLAKRLKQNQEIAFTAGLLSGIGQIVLDVCLPREFGQVLQQAADGSTLIEAERALLGFDHATIGAEVAKRWNFPAAIQHAIRFHYAPVQEPFEPISAVVSVAARLVQGLDSGTAPDELPQRLPEPVAQRLGLERDAIEACLAALDEMSAAAGMLTEP